MLTTGLHFLLLFPQLLLAFLVAYLLLFTLVAFFGKRNTARPSGGPTQRFLFLIPAHNEEKLLPQTLDTLAQLDYPQELYEVHVVADNCSDGTAEVVRASQAQLHERFNTELIGKGFALQWLLERLWAAEVPHDAVVIVDADTSVSNNFLQVMDARLRRGERVIQAYYAVRDPGQAWSVSLRYAALAVLHYLRPQARMVLGGSTGLKGNGMVFAADVMRGREWTAHLTEDIEFHMDLVLHGERAMFAPDAVVEAEMPTSLSDSQTQNVRWERGRLDMAKTFVPQLVRQAFSDKGRNGRWFLLLDAAMEHIIPPFSLLFGATVLGLLLSLALLPFSSGQLLLRLNLGLALFNLGGQVLYLLAGLILARAPGSVYRALIYAPFFVLWKIWLYIRILLGRDQDGWIRTKRNEEAPTS